MDTAPPFINKLEFLEPKIEDAIPTYQVVNQNGEVLCPSQDPQVRLNDFLSSSYQIL